MAWTYTITIAGIGTVSVESLSEVLKIDESLDSALIVIPRVTRKATYPRFAEVSIVVSDGTNTDSSYWVIYSDKVEVVNAGTTLRYDHTLGLIEPIKMLEKFACGSLTFTQPLGGTRYTMFDVVERLRQLTPFVPYSLVSTTRKFTIDSTLATALDLIDAPQFYLDKKNLREALIEVFKAIHAIPRIRFTAIAGAWVLYADYINNWQTNITPNGEDETALGIIDHTTEISGEDYSTATESYLENVVPSEDNTTPNVVTELVSFSTEDAVMGDGNFTLLLSNKAANIVGLEAYITAGITEGAVGYHRSKVIDLLNSNPVFLYEKKVFDTLDYDNAVGNQPYAIYWAYGDNEIGGSRTTYGMFDTQIAIEKIADAAVKAQYGTGYSNESVWYEIVFKVSYIPYIETMRTLQYRDDLALNTKLKSEEAVMQINQNERINNLFNATNNIYGQTQRLGVDTLSFSKKHRTLHVYDSTHTDGIYSLGDYTANGYIIVKVEKVYFNSFVIGRYEVSKEFNRIAQFIPISREFRSYEISLAKTDYTLKRDILMPFFKIVVASSAHESHVSNALITPFMNTFMTGTYDVGIKGASFQIGASSTVFGDDGVYMPVVACAEKNTIKFKVDFKDVKLAGNRIEKSTGVTYWAKKQAIYTDNDGRIDYIKIELYNHYWDLLGEQDTSGIYYQYGLRKIAYDLPHINVAKTVVCDDSTFSVNIVTVTTVATLPASGTAGVYYYALDTGYISEWVPSAWLGLGYAVATKNAAVYTMPVYQRSKDGAEIDGYEMFMPIIPASAETPSFVIGDMLSKDNCLIKERGTSKTLYFYHSHTRYTKANTAKLNTADRLATTVSAYVSGNTIAVPAGITSNYDYYAIGDFDGNMYLGVNQVGLDGVKTAVSTIAFNFLTER